MPQPGEGLGVVNGPGQVLSLTVKTWLKIVLTIFAHEIGSFWTFEFTNELLFSIDLTANLETAIFWNHIIKILAAWIFGFINWFFIFIFFIIWFFFIVFTSDTSTEWLVEFPDSFFIFFAFSLGISFEGLAKVGLEI